MDPTTEHTRAFIRECIRRVRDEQDLTALQELLDPDPAVQTEHGLISRNCSTH